MLIVIVKLKNSFDDITKNSVNKLFLSWLCRRKAFKL